MQNVDAVRTYQHVAIFCAIDIRHFVSPHYAL
jgi:hypothetical protein